MLVSEPNALRVDPIMTMIALAGGRISKPREIKPGLYEIGHFGSSDFLPNYENYPDVSVGPYGVCDSPEQLLEKCPELEGDMTRLFVVTVTKISKDSESSEDGWRWHKWGDYIGDQNPQCEYLYDEPEIDEVYTFHIYEKESQS